MTLQDLKVGQRAVITAVGGEGALRCRLLDMGLIPKTAVRTVRIAPMGDPIEINVRGYELTIRKADAALIEIELTPTYALTNEENTLRSSLYGCSSCPYAGRNADGSTSCRSQQTEGNPCAGESVVTPTSSEQSDELFSSAQRRSGTRSSTKPSAQGDVAGDGTKKGSWISRLFRRTKKGGDGQ